MSDKREASVLYQTFVEADRIRTQALKDGMPRDDANAMVAAALKQAWPRGREKAWQYVCESCHDTGWEVRICGHGLRCQRSKAHLPHEFVQPCWCAKGQALTPKPRAQEDELAAIGKTKGRHPTRFGS